MLKAPVFKARPYIAMFYLPCEINHEKLHVFKCGSKANARNTAQYIIERQASRTELLSIRDRCSLFTEKDLPANYEIALEYLPQMVGVELEQNTLSIFFYLTPGSMNGRKLNSAKLKQEGIDLNLNHEFSLSISERFKKEYLDLKLTVIEGTTQYSDQIRFHFAEQKNIFDVVIDYGSEASQVAIHHRKPAVRY